MDQKLLLRFLFFGLIFLAVILETLSDILFKKWSIDNRHIFFVVGLIIYFTGTVIWAFSLKYEPLSKAISIFTILNFIMVVLAGVIIFDEKLSLMNKGGIILGIVSIILMEL